MNDAVRSSLGAASRIERSKNRQYKARAEREHAQFFPFVLETYGGFGKNARALVKLIANHAAAASALWSPVDITQGILQGVFEELHLRNLRLLNSELAKCHAPPPPRRSMHPARNIIRTLSARGRHRGPQIPLTPSSPRSSPIPSLLVSSRLADQTNPISPNEILDVELKCLYCDDEGERALCDHFNHLPSAVLSAPTALHGMQVTAP